MKGIRRLFLPHVGMRGSVEHLFEEFQNSLWAGRENCQDVPEEIRESHHSRLAHGARQRKALLPGELQSLREALCELLSHESCGEWLGFNDLSCPDIKPPLRSLAGLIREPDWTDAENMHKLRMYRAAAFADRLRPSLLDWETPHIPDMEWVLEFIETFTRPGISAEDQTDLIDDLSRPHVPLDTIVRTERGPRLKLSPSELRYVWETNDLSHEERAKAWDSRTPKPFHPFGRSNCEMYRDEKLTHRWRSAVNHQRDKAKARYGLDPGDGEGEAN
ncbi:MAG TPA: hypothetical protein VFI38_14690 [Candidatus Acidoferrum sp.]|nr:hypothetical protein [Candidatus Acidoferrum sp.]